MKDKTRRVLKGLSKALGDFLENYWFMCLWDILCGSIAFTLMKFSAAYIPYELEAGLLMYGIGVIVCTIILFSNLIIIRLTQIRERLPNGNE